ncbi:hypothetical protein [Rhodococcus sp. BE178]|uniref:VG15 protein n=1 Tax=Rhodococcus sp. BE178 TaxID=2817737 RepID=UPI003D1B32E5
MIPDAAVEYYRGQQELTLEALAIATDIWGSRPPRDFDAWFDQNIEALVELVIVAQGRAAASADGYVVDVLDELGTPVAAEVEAVTAGLVGVASDGRALDSLMYGAVITAKGRVAEGAGVAQAWDSGLAALVRRVQTQIADAARVSTGLSITARPRVGYVRMLNPPACSRCVVLAGKFYRYNVGFRRHPGCDCRHIPSREDRSDDLRTDPKAYFDGLSEEQQDKQFTIAGAQAIRDGADINQVVNARRGAHGLDVAGRLQRRDVYGQQLHTTTEGVTKRGLAGKAIITRGRSPKTTPRLMPEAIYELAGSREEALKLLRMNGYVLDRPGAPRAGATSPNFTSTSRRDGLVRAADGGGKGPTKPPINGRAVSVGDDDRSWRVPDDEVPESYPEMLTGGAVHFLPKDRPDVASKAVHIIVGDDKGGGHGDGAGKGKSEFTGWTDHEVLAAIDLTLVAPYSVERIGSKLFFRRVVNGIPVEVLVAARKPTPTLQTGYPNKEALNSIKNGKGKLRWGM